MMRRFEISSLRRTFGRTARSLAGVALATFLGAVAFAEPLSFTEAIARVDQAPTVVIAERAVALARRQLELVGSPLRAELGGGYARTWGERVAAEGAPPVDLADGNFDPVRLVLTLPHLGVGPSADAEARARADLARAEADLAAVRRGQRIELTAAYAGALRATRSADLARAEAALATLELEAAQARFEAGAVTATDVARVEAAVSRAESAVHAADREAALALARLELALGTPGVTPTEAPPTPEVSGMPTSSASTATAGAAAQPAATLAVADLTALDLTMLRAVADGVATPGVDAMSARPDVMAAALAVAESERSAAATLRDNLPSGSLNASFAHGNDRNALTLGAALDSRSLTPSVSASYDPDDGLPGLMEGGSNTAFSLGVSVRIPLDVSVGSAIDGARLARERAAAQLELAIARAELDLRRLAHDVVTAWESVEAAERAANLAADDAEMAQRRFAAGTLSELAARRSGLEAERARLDAERAGDAMHLAWLRYLDGLAAVPAALE
jgi:outer membrane protein TolC